MIIHKLLTDSDSILQDMAMLRIETEDGRIIAKITADDYSIADGYKLILRPFTYNETAQYGHDPVEIYLAPDGNRWIVEHDK